MCDESEIQHYSCKSKICNKYDEQMSVFDLHRLELLIAQLEIYNGVVSVNSSTSDCESERQGASPDIAPNMLE